jgi:hypothetical protein
VRLRSHHWEEQRLQFWSFCSTGISTSARIAEAFLNGASAPGDQVDNQNDQRHYQQNMNQAAGDVQAKAQKPQNHKNYEYCPKHLYILFRIART